MIKPTSPVDLLMRVVQRLGQHCEKVVFVGGTTVPLLVIDPGAGAPRVTRDVDCIVQVEKLSEYYNFVHRLEQIGFSPDQSGPICRYEVDGLYIDIMPTESSIMGFSNRWYREGTLNAVQVSLPDGSSVKILSAPSFIASKLEAFRGRGEDDYMASHDLEDLISVIDGRSEIVSETEAVESRALKEYLGSQMFSLLNNEKFSEALPGHLGPDQASQARRSIVVSRMKAIAELIQSSSD